MAAAYVSGSFQLILTYKFSIAVVTASVVSGIAAAKKEADSEKSPHPYLFYALYRNW